MTQRTSRYRTGRILGTNPNLRRTRRGTPPKLITRCIAPTAIVCLLLTFRSLIVSHSRLATKVTPAERAAVCLSGQVRTFAQTWPSVKARFLDRLPYSYDLHLVFNDEEERTKGMRILREEQHLPGGVGVYDTMRIDPFTGYRENAQEGHFGELGELSDWEIYKARTPAGSAGGYLYQLAGLDSCLHLRKSVEAERGFRYTHAARIRFDTLFESDLPDVRSIIMGPAQGEVEGGGIIVPKMQSHDGYNDKMALGAVGHMEIYQSQLRAMHERGLPFNKEWCGGLEKRIPRKREARRKRRLQPEACMEAYLIDRGVRAMPVEVRVQILREDGTLSKT